jgi:hypothetical protein
MSNKLAFLSCGLVGVALACGDGGAAFATPILEASPNWSGYADTLPADSGYTVSSVSGSWYVPTVQAPPGSSSAYSSIWVGIDGLNENALEQIGISANVVNGQTQYGAWYEMLPADPTSIPITVPGAIPIRAGDLISSSASYNASTKEFTLAISDLTAGNPDNFSITIAGSGQPRLTAEWIVEDPTVNGSLPTLADFGPVSFSGLGSVEGAGGLVASGPIDSASNVGGTTYQLWMQQGGSAKAAPTPLADNGGVSSFTDVYVAEPSAAVLLALGAAAYSLLHGARKRPH